MRICMKKIIAMFSLFLGIAALYSLSADTITSSRTDATVQNQHQVVLERFFAVNEETNLASVWDPHTHRLIPLGSKQPVISMLQRKNGDIWMAEISPPEEDTSAIMIMSSTGEQVRKIELPLARIDLLAGAEGDWVYARSGEIDREGNNLFAMIPVHPDGVTKVLMVPGVIQKLISGPDESVLAVSADLQSGIYSLYRLDDESSGVHLLVEGTVEMPFLDVSVDRKNGKLAIFESGALASIRFSLLDMRRNIRSNPVWLPSGFAGPVDLPADEHLQNIRLILNKDTNPGVQQLITLSDQGAILKSERLPFSTDQWLLNNGIVVARSAERPELYVFDPDAPEDFEIIHSESRVWLK